MHKKKERNIPEKIFLSTDISQILFNSFSIKCKDSDFPLISCVIGNTTLDRVLFDIGTCINLLPQTVYQQLGLGKF